MIRIEEFLPRGKENAISTENLCKVTGIIDKRALQQEIARERAEGALILSHYSGGYYLPCSRSEVAEFVRTLENRAKNTFVALRSARRYLRTTEGQTTLNINKSE